MSFQKRLQSKEFVLLAEMDMPKGVDISEMIINARRIKGRVDAVVIPDMGNAVMKMSALGGGLLMNSEGIEPVIQMCCRDRNRIALQGDLLSAHALGIQSLVVIPGDDISYGDQNNAQPVNDLDEHGLLDAICTLRDGKDMGGFELNGAPQFMIGANIPPETEGTGVDEQIALARKKVAAGAQYLISPPVFDIDKFKTLMEKLDDLNTPIIATVFLLKSVGMARYMTSNVPGVTIPDELISRIRSAKNRVDECVRIAGETIKSLRNVCNGACIVSLGWEVRLPEVLDYADA